ncbi:MAG: PQQ-dependent dehydrogenase, methanol/ethanol family [bacterium]|nr:PQQ-dependent dehydrogenase, methanol/ethanol family [bacterium]
MFEGCGTGVRGRRIASLFVVLAIACGGDEELQAPEPPSSASAEQQQQEVVLGGPESVNDARLRAADAEPGNWLTHGRTYSEQRFSPLDEVDADNVHQLQATWKFETGLKRGHEATPIVLDGIMYFTGSWSVVFALDARTGEQVWKWDPFVPRDYAQKACCDVVNRGVALYRGRVYAGVLDGRLAALDARTGELVWEKLTVDRSRPYTITGAPRIVDGKVIIGNGGAELGVRGYVSAYDTQNGDLIWRTYTVPGDPAKPFESPALEAAAETWKGGEWWKIGGGGTVWDSMAFDPELKLLYIGTGNGSPWTRHIRSPGGGDNLFLSSILALNPDNGELIWHYQTTPGDNWDYTATQHMILADLEIDGDTRKVLMQAPKNGFFYVLDRKTGELISAEKYVEVTWASNIDPKTGRPVEVPGQDYKDALALVKPTPFGGHNWHPMSYSPKTGLVYIPAQDMLGAYRVDPHFTYKPGLFNTGTDFNTFALAKRDGFYGHLLAWDPVAQKEVWRHPHALPWNGGTLATAGDLVFQGTADGRFVAYRASDGKKLWEEPAGTGVIAAPITYQVDGRQYVTIVAGWGGAFALAGGEGASAAGVESRGRVLTFALAGPPPTAAQALERITMEDSVHRGERIYHVYCAGCHGAQAFGGGVLPDLRKSKPEIRSAFNEIVLRGIFSGKGMPSFAPWLTEKDTALLIEYIDQRIADTAN